MIHYTLFVLILVLILNVEKPKPELFREGRSIKRALVEHVESGESLIARADRDIEELGL